MSNNVMQYVVMIRTDTSTTPVYTAISVSSNIIPPIEKRELLVDFINESTAHICDDVVAIFTKDGVHWSTDEFEESKSGQLENNQTGEVK